MAVKFGPYTVRLGPGYHGLNWSKVWLALFITAMLTFGASVVFWIGYKIQHSQVDTFVPKGCHCVKCLNLDCTKYECCDFAISNTGSH